jgi:hypothetical protein
MLLSILFLLSASFLTLNEALYPSKIASFDVILSRSSEALSTLCLRSRRPKSQSCKSSSMPVLYLGPADSKKNLA